MRLLLTSNGLSNQSIANTLFDLVGKPAEEISVVYIPTASNVEMGDKDWMINDILNLYKQNFKQIDIADISAVPESIWRPKFETADVMFFEGGNAFHLMRWIQKSGLRDLLPEYMKSKVWVGVSAGSMVTNKDLSLKFSQEIYGEDLNETENLAGLKYVDFYFLPHLNSEYFTKLRKENIEKVAQGFKEKIYALDNNSALKIIDENIEIISEGEYLELN
ncbi:MAG TPA: Type 1 glutamine amidotransferase-like domain-containing protein [Candidatus Paceibacterota bacterium]|nr:Type 1 glutamine amidotransferase-like domain-containing protein [Candidatus Paceibacterota bacterium]